MLSRMACGPDGAAVQRGVGRMRALRFGAATATAAIALDRIGGDDRVRCNCRVGDDAVCVGEGKQPQRLHDQGALQDDRPRCQAGDCPVTSTGAPAPTVAGIYDNVVSGNTANGDGTKGLGGGILLAGGAPGTGVYDNVVVDNTADGDGLGGVTIHSHAPGQDLNGNVIVGNTLSDDGIAGSPGGKPGDVDFGITQTVGIIVASAVSTLEGTVVADNTVSNDYYGIWTKNVPTISASANTFSAVTTPLSQN